MKTALKLFTLLTAVLAFAACKPEHPEPDKVRYERDIVYYVDGENHHAAGQGEDQWNTLLDNLLDQAAEGSTVTFYNENIQPSLSKTKGNVTFSTTSREEMKAWCTRMEDAGMTVTITYDTETGVWNGIAYAVMHHASSAFDGEGASLSTFSVGNGVAVRFSRGILQYKATTDSWRFAQQQFDCVGHANEFFGTGYDGWVDLHGWDSNGYSQSGWRLMTHDEATYLMTQRSASTVNGVENARYTLAVVNNLHGLILFPDNYDHPADVTLPVGINNNGQTPTTLQENGWYSNLYTIADWQRMEEAGAIFLPTAGRRNGTTVYDFNKYGLFWLADSLGSDKAYVLSVWERYTGTGTAELRQMGGPVRLVKEDR